MTHVSKCLRPFFFGLFAWRVQNEPSLHLNVVAYYSVKHSHGYTQIVGNLFRRSKAPKQDRAAVLAFKKKRKK